MIRVGQGRVECVVDGELGCGREGDCCLKVWTKKGVSSQCKSRAAFEISTSGLDSFSGVSCQERKENGRSTGESSVHNLPR